MGLFKVCTCTFQQDVFTVDEPCQHIVGRCILWIEHIHSHAGGKRMKEKRAVLDGVAAELRRIIGEPTETGLRLVA